MFGPLRIWLLSPRITFGKSLLSPLLLLLFSFSFIYICIAPRSSYIRYSRRVLLLWPNAASFACETANIDAMNFHWASFGEDHLPRRVNFEREGSRGVDETTFFRLVVVFIVCSIYFILAVFVLLSPRSKLNLETYFYS